MKYFILFLFSSFIVWLIVLADLDKENFLIRAGHVVPFGDKIGHFTLFGLFSLILNYALDFRNILFFKRKVLLGSVVILSFAIAEEFSQILFESRTFDWTDMMFDFAGVQMISSSWFISKITKLKTFNIPIKNQKIL